MLYFPQLSTGAVGQYPIQKRRLTRTVVNEASELSFLLDEEFFEGFHLRLVQQVEAN